MLASCALCLICAGISFAFFCRKDPKPIFNVYTQPGKWYWLKYPLFMALFYYRRHTSKNKAVGTNNAGQGMKALSDIEELEKPQQLSDHPLAFDAVFFISTALTKEGDSIYIVIGCERRQNNICMGPFYVGLPGKGLLCSKKLPDTLLFGHEENQFGAEGILIKVIKPMREWRVSYNGEMWYQNDSSKKVRVEFDGTFTSSEKYFDYDTDLYGPAVARSIATEPWTREYFEVLREAHQSHYEQFGKMKANLKIEDEEHQFDLKSFRDHSFGKKRDWSLMHRYAFHQIFLENGVNMVVGVICQPCTSSSFEVGFVNLQNGDQLPLEWCDLKLYQHGENGTAPKDYAYSFKAGDIVYTVQVNVEYEATHFVSFEWEARMVERFCRYTVNGVNGIGVSEFHYNNKNGRPQEYKDKDPEWYRNMKLKT